MNQPTNEKRTSMTANLHLHACFQPVGANCFVQLAHFSGMMIPMNRFVDKKGGVPIVMGVPQ